MKLLRIASPIAVTKCVFTLAGSAVGLVSTATRGTAHLALSGVHLLAGLGDEAAGRGQTDSAAVTELTTTAATAEADATGGSAGAGSVRATVPVEPHPPEEAPIDVVGLALAAEEAAGDRAIPEGAGYAHEPRGASRDEEHGDAALPQAEADALAEEAAALDEDVEPEEEHLTQPLIEPGEAAALAAEMRTARRGADRHKG